MLTHSSYDKAVTKHALSSGESYIACLSAKCGRYFSIEDCKNTKHSKQRVACPYCEHEICLKCNRPWSSHGKGGCDQAKKAEDDLSKRAVKTMGAKPCPKCGMNIQKHGGCDHMTCKSRIRSNISRESDTNVHFQVSNAATTSAGCVSLSTPRTFGTWKTARMRAFMLLSILAIGFLKT